MNSRYIAISRKFRPQTFDQVIGQDNCVIALQNALKLNRISHAYLFSGTRGCGKTTLARLFAKALTCPKPTANFNPCNSCDQCRAIDQSRSMDVIEIDGASNRGIDDIRQLRENVGYSAGLGNWRIYIIDEVHMLTKEAFNALLKTLEDPPSSVIFLLATTESHRIPVTIQSRCQRYILNLVDVDLIENKLRLIMDQGGISYEDEALALIAAAAEGSVRDAESLLDQVLCLSDESVTADHVQNALGLVNAHWFFKLDLCVQHKDIGKIFNLAKELLSAGIDLSNACLQLTKHFRNHLLMGIFSQDDLSRQLMQLPKSLIASYAERVGIYNQDHCLAILDVIKQHQVSFKSNTYSCVYLEMMLIEIVKSSELISWSSMWNRLDHIQNIIVQGTSLTSSEALGALKTKESTLMEQAKNDILTVASVQISADSQSAADSSQSRLEQMERPPILSDQQLPKDQIEKIDSSTAKPAIDIPVGRLDTILHFARVEFGGQIQVE